MRKRIRRGDPQKRRYWEGVIRRWRESGQSVRAFCQAEGVRESAFYFWRRKLARTCPPSRAAGRPRPGTPRLALAVCSTKGRSGPRPSPASFVPVEVVARGSGDPASRPPADRPTSQAVEIVLPDGCFVRVPNGVDRQTLADVLAVLEAGPC